MLEQVQLYRTLLKTIKMVFKNDLPVIEAAKFKLRSSFDTNRILCDDQKIQEQIKYGHSVTQFLLKNIAQGVRINSPSSHGDSNVRYLVKIEERHEITTNDLNPTAMSAKTHSLGPCKVKCQGCSCEI